MLRFVLSGLSWDHFYFLCAPGHGQFVPYRCLELFQDVTDDGVLFFFTESYLSMQ